MKPKITIVKGWGWWRCRAPRTYSGVGYSPLEAYERWLYLNGYGPLNTK